MPRDLHREALIATGVVLFVFILLINLSFSALQEEEKGMKRAIQSTVICLARVR